MTVPSTNARNDYAGNGVADSFAYTFRIFDAGDLRVLEQDAEGEEAELTLDADYTVTGVGDAGGGNVVLSSPLPDGHQLTILRELDLVQETDFRNQGAFFAQTHEDALDRLTMMVQQLRDGLVRALRLRPTDFGADVVLPKPEADLLLGWNADASALVNRSSQTTSGITLADGSVTTPKLADQAVTAAKLAAGAVQIRKATFTDNASTTSTNASGTGLEVKLTPIHADSIIVVMTSGMGLARRASGTHIFRTATFRIREMNSGQNLDGGGGRFGRNLAAASDEDAESIFAVTLMGVHEPGATIEQHYQLMFEVGSDGGPGSAQDGDVSVWLRGADISGASIIAMEVRP